MPRVVQTINGVEALQPAWQRGGFDSVRSMALYDGYTHDYATLYRTQPNVRTVVDFLARNIAQLGLHVFRRVSDTDRERLTDHPLAQVIERPNDRTTRYRLISGTMLDLGVYFNAYWLKVRSPRGLTLLKVPPWAVHVKGRLIPTQYLINFHATTLLAAESSDDSLILEPSEIVHFRGDSVDSGPLGLSPLETLRRVLAEEHEAGEYRAGFWQNAARMGGIIKRPKDAPEWSPEARSRFKAEFEALYSGSQNSGRTAILEEGMEWQAMSFSARDSEYLAGRKLTREEVARAYHVPLPMVGILDHATFSNIAEQHKQLYQDTLGPWLQMLAEDIELQLLGEFGSDGVYVEFNINEKLRGSFEEQVASLQSAVGRPYMTADEARARLNLPSLGGDAEALVTPLNVLVGGQASPRDSAPKALPSGQKAADVDEGDIIHVRTRERHVEKWAEVMARFFERQGKAVVSAVGGSGSTPAVDGVFDAERWNRELAGDLLVLNLATAEVFARKVAAELELDGFEPSWLAPWLTENARIAAEGINATTRDQVATALVDDDPTSAARHLFEVAAASRATQIAQSKVTTAANFGGHKAAEVAGVKLKVWRQNSGNPRSAHRALSGVTIEIGQRFSNGQLWPGDPAGGADDNANCQCSVTFRR